MMLCASSVLGLQPLTEKADQLRALQQENPKPVMPVFEIEDVGTGTDRDPLQARGEIQPQVCVLRLSRFEPTLPGKLRRIAVERELPWWAVIPANGSVAELRLLTHLALAHGARGLLYASLQGGVEAGGLVHYLTLRPLDDKLATLGELGRVVSASAEQLRTLRPGTHAVTCKPQTVLAVPVLIHDKPGVYVVNSLVGETVDCALSSAAETVRDLYTGETFAKQSGGDMMVPLAAGQGRLLIEP